MLTTSNAAFKHLHSCAYDAPITAIEGVDTGAVYFASGNVLYCSNSGIHSGNSVSRRSAAAPPGTTITTIAVAQVNYDASPDQQISRLPLLLMGAADRLLIQLDTGCDMAPFHPCVAVLHTAESRVLRIFVDQTQGAVIVLTTSNDIFYGSLAEIAVGMRTIHASSSWGEFRDQTEAFHFLRVPGPRLGVVLSADCITSRLTPPGGAGVGILLHQRLFVATYAGEVVEWLAVEIQEAMKEGNLQHSSLHRCGRWRSRIVSHVRAHSPGCAVFAVRVRETIVPDDFAAVGSSRVLRVRTHLVTCSDDRSAALYERCSGNAEEPWVLLWRGCGADFARSRIFDVALHVDSGRVSWEHLSRNSSHSSRYSVLVGVAGEDGCVQAFEIDRVASHAEPPTAFQRLEYETTVVPLFIRRHQHRGRGAYRVAFLRTHKEEWTLVSGGFDGAVFEHALWSDSTRTRGRYVLPLDGTEKEAEEVKEAASSSRLCRETRETRSSSLHGMAPASTGVGHDVSTARSRKGARSEQVRVVHVDTEGRLLACTRTALCVLHDKPTTVLQQQYSTSSWRVPLPSAATRQAMVGGSESLEVRDYGYPSTLASVALPVSGAERSMAEALVGCALVGTTSGLLHMAPYACTFPEDTCSRPTTLVSVSSIEETSTVEGSTFTSAPSVFLSSLQTYGKITHIAVTAAMRGSVLDSDIVSAVGDVFEVLIATNHVRDAVALTKLHLSFSIHEVEDSHTIDDAVMLFARVRWEPLTLYSACPGTRSTALALYPEVCSWQGTAYSHREEGHRWLFIGDKQGCLLGARVSTSGAAALTTAEDTPLERNPLAPTPTVSLKAVADIFEYVFDEQLRIPITALYVESPRETRGGGDEQGGTSSALLTVAGSGGCLAFLSLPEGSRRATNSAGRAAPLPSCSKEPLRLPFEVSTVLALSKNLLVTQCGTTVSVMYRECGRTAWVPLGYMEGVRAPRLFAARTCSSTSPFTGPVAFFTHCSDGRAVEKLICHPGSTSSVPLRAYHSGLPLTVLQHGAGLPGKDYTCAAYAPPPFDCLLMGNEDCTVSLYPIDMARARDAPRPCTGVPPLRECLAPVNLCGTHHANVLAIAVLPPRNTSPCSFSAKDIPVDVDTPERCSSTTLRFVSVGSGAMICLWAADETSPLRLLDWWCGGTSSVPLHHNKVPVSIDSADAHAALAERRIGVARYEKKRTNVAVGTTPLSWIQADRIPRFMTVTAWDLNNFAVGGSDGELRFFRVEESGLCGAVAVQDVDRSNFAMHLCWQGSLNSDCCKPIMCINSTQTDQHCLVTAGDTNSIVYVVDAASHKVITQLQLEQSCVNAIGELQAQRSVPPHGQGKMEGRRWKFAALCDSGVIHLLELFLSHDAAGSSPVAELRKLACNSTGVTAGRRVLWPTRRGPLVVVTEERLLEYDAEAAAQGDLRLLRERRTSVRCVSGATFIGDAASGEEQRTARGLVAVVGQGFEIVSF